jgi:membrane associated rhomboid family serine protease
MSFLRRLERTLAPYAVHNVTLALVVLQGAMWLLMQGRPEIVENLVLDRALLLEGQWWRLFTFIFLPPMTNGIFLFFALWFLYMMGTALENQWGAFRFNLYLLIGYLATVASVFIAPEGIATNTYLMTSIFLAFAYLYPDFQILLFFILPVKAKWIALVTWIFYILSFALGDWLTRTLIVASVSNFLLFFGREILQNMKLGRRRMARKMGALVVPDDAINRCIICGVTEKTDKRMEFRYCPDCAGTPCYCIMHMQGHTHRK